MNPFAINQNIYPTSFMGGSHIGGGQPGGIQGPIGAQGPQGGGKTGFNPQGELNEVSIIGANKREGFEVGLGGTNNPDDHKLFMVA